MSELGIPINVEKSDISIGLNATILLVFGMGMYTVIYLGTMYIYLTRSSESTSKPRIVPVTITALFLCTFFFTSIQWYSTKLQFVDDGDTRDSVFLSLLETPLWVNLSVDISSNDGLVLADGLLIWRCYFVWECSFRAILLSLFLIITEIALFVAVTIFQGISGYFSTTAAAAEKLNSLTCAAFFAAFATSLVTTILIAYRIYSVSKRGVSKRRFKHIINMVVQSGAAYSLSLLVYAISNVLPGGSDIYNPPGIALSLYSAALTNVIAGISATVLVARVSMLPTNTTFPSTSIHLSGLQFHVHSTHQTDTPGVMEVGHPVNVDRNPVCEGLQVEDKA